MIGNNGEQKARRAVSFNWANRFSIQNNLEFTEIDSANDYDQISDLFNIMVDNIIAGKIDKKEDP